MSDYIKELFETLYISNKYLITITNTANNKWQIYIYKNQHIQLDVQIPNALTSQYIDISKLVEYIENEPEVKIKYVCYYDDFKLYNKMMIYILNEIQLHYSKENKNIIIVYESCH
jgi:hypothetical protein